MSKLPPESILPGTFELMPAGPAGTMSERLIEWFPGPALLVAGAGRVVALNSAARGILADEDGLVLAGNRLRALRDTDNAILWNALDCAADSRRSASELVPGPQWLALARPSGKHPYALLISPLGPVVDDGALGGGLAMVIVVDPDRPAKVSEVLLTRIFGLTHAEASITRCLVSGMSPQECAQLRGATRHSVRAHLNRVYHKTGTRRQSELVALALRLCILEQGTDSRSIVSSTPLAPTRGQRPLSPEQIQIVQPPDTSITAPLM